MSQSDRRSTLTQFLVQRYCNPRNTVFCDPLYWLKTKFQSDLAESFIRDLLTASVWAAHKLQWTKPLFDSCFAHLDSLIVVVLFSKDVLWRCWVSSTCSSCTPMILLYFVISGSWCFLNHQKNLFWFLGIKQVHSSHWYLKHEDLQQKCLKHGEFSSVWRERKAFLSLWILNLSSWSIQRSYKSLLLIS